MGTLTIRKHADLSDGRERVPGVHPATGERALLNKETGEPDPYPLAGVSLRDPPQTTSISTSKVSEGKREGWLELVNERPVHRPGGPAADKWSTTHTFLHADAIVFHTIHGDIRYRVVRQPDKYVDNEDPADPVTPEVYEAGHTRVEWVYQLEREN